MSLYTRPRREGRSLDAINETWGYWLNEVCNQKSKGCKFSHIESDRSQKLPLLENDMDHGGDCRAFHCRSLPHLSQARSAKTRRKKGVAFGSSAVQEETIPLAFGLQQCVVLLKASTSLRRLWVPKGLRSPLTLCSQALWRYRSPFYNTTVRK